MSTKSRSPDRLAITVAADGWFGVWGTTTGGTKADESLSHSHQGKLSPAQLKKLDQLVSATHHFRDKNDGADTPTDFESYVVAATHESTWRESICLNGGEQPEAYAKLFQFIVPLIEKERKKLPQISWLPFSQERFDAAVKKQQPILISFSAGWTSTAYFEHEAVWSSPGLASEVKDKGIVCLRGDITGNGPSDPKPTDFEDFRKNMFAGPGMMLYLPKSNKKIEFEHGKLKTSEVLPAIQQAFVTSSESASTETKNAKMKAIDGVYTGPRSFMNDKGEEQKVIPYSWYALELHQGRFRLWMYSDAGGMDAKHPITGTFARTGNKIVLDHEQSYPPKRYVRTTINGVSGLWTEDGLKQWQQAAGAQVISPAILVRVADSPYREKMPEPHDYSVKPAGFSYPSIKPLYDMDAVKKYWKNRADEHETRYSDIPEPLRALLRERTREDDGDMVGYKQAIQRIQANPDPLVIKQLVEIMGSGPHQVVAPAVLKDIFLSSVLLPDQPAFMKTKDSRQQALAILVDVIDDAKDGTALTPVLLVLLEASGIDEMKLKVGNQNLAFSRKEGGISYQSFTYSPEVSKACQAWFKSQLEPDEN